MFLNHGYGQGVNHPPVKNDMCIDMSETTHGGNQITDREPARFPNQLKTDMGPLLGRYRTGFLTKKKKLAIDETNIECSSNDALRLEIKNKDTA